MVNFKRNKPRSESKHAPNSSIILAISGSLLLLCYMLEAVGAEQFGQAKEDKVSSELFATAGKVYVETFSVDGLNATLSVKLEDVNGTDEYWLLDFQPYQYDPINLPISVYTGYLSADNTGQCSSVEEDQTWASGYFDDEFFQNRSSFGNKLLFTDYIRGNEVMNGFRGDVIRFEGRMNTFLTCERTDGTSIWESDIYDEEIEFNTVLYATNLRPQPSWAADASHQLPAVGFVQSNIHLIWRLARTAIVNFIITSKAIEHIDLFALFDYAIVEPVLLEDGLTPDIEHTKLSMGFTTYVPINQTAMLVWVDDTVTYTPRNPENQLTEVVVDPPNILADTPPCNVMRDPDYCLQSWNYEFVLLLDITQLSLEMPMEATGIFGFDFNLYECTDVATAVGCALKVDVEEPFNVKIDLTLQSTVTAVDEAGDSIEVEIIGVTNGAGEDIRNGVIDNGENITMETVFHPAFLRDEYILDLHLFMVCKGAELAEDSRGCLAAPEEERFTSFVSPDLAFPYDPSEDPNFELIPTTPVPSVDGTTCKHGWERLNDNCYFLVHRARSTYAMASSQCNDRQAELATITSQEEQDFLADFLRYFDVNGGYYIGLNDIDSEGTFVWADGTQFHPVNSFTSWIGGEPNNLGDEDCVGMKYASGGGWNDYTCSAELAYICVKPADLWGEWGDWSYCTVSCGSGTRYRRRFCENEDFEGCPGMKNFDQQDCFMPSCNLFKNSQGNVLTYESTDVDMAYNDSMEYCQSKGGRLADINSYGLRNHLLSQYEYLMYPKAIPLTGLQATQSTTGYAGHASLAIDGIRSTTYSDGSCTHTGSITSSDSSSDFLDNPQWWKVDLVGLYCISKVSIVNRGDCCAPGSTECFSDALGRDYRGMVNVTHSGLACQSWATQTPQSHDRTNIKYPGTGLGDHNYCRNPDGEAGAWCYTMDPDIRWQLCDIGTALDTCTGDDRLIDSIVKIGNDSAIDNNPQCGSVISERQAGPGVTVDVLCDEPICGQYVSIHSGLGVDYGILTMCEVMVYGYSAEYDLNDLCLDENTVGWSVENRTNNITQSPLVLVYPDQTIPCDGMVTDVSFWANEKAVVALFIWRPTESNDTFNLVSVTYIVNEVGLNEYSIPEDERTAVKKGDVLGLYRAEELDVAYDIKEDEGSSLELWMSFGDFEATQNGRYVFNTGERVSVSLSVTVKPHAEVLPYYWVDGYQMDECIAFDDDYAVSSLAGDDLCPILSDCDKRNVQALCSRSLRAICEYDHALAFHAVGGNSENVLSLWESTTSHDDPSRVDNEPHRRHYKSKLVEDWDQKVIGVEEVKVVLQKYGEDVLTLTFDGTRSNKYDWFTKDRLLNSPYDEIDDYNSFAITGYDGKPDRNFYINQRFGACTNDVGWLVVLDDHDDDFDGCAYELAVPPEKPAFLYSNGNTATRWMEAPVADSLLIYLKYKELDVVEPSNYTLAFRGVAGSGSDILGLWESLDYSDNALRRIPYWQHYKSVLVEKWDRLLIAVSEVKVELRSNGDTVFEMTFDGQGSNKNNWFSLSRLISSPYDDLNQDTDPNYFAIQGHTELNRHFFINDFYNGCPADRGWFAVIDYGSFHPCAYDNSYGSEFPKFLYSRAPSSKSTSWDTGAVGVADEFLIFIKYTDTPMTPSPPTYPPPITYSVDNIAPTMPGRELNLVEYDTERDLHQCEFTSRPLAAERVITTMTVVYGLVPKDRRRKRDIRHRRSLVASLQLPQLQSASFGTNGCPPYSSFNQVEFSCECWAGYHFNSKTYRCDEDVQVDVITYHDFKNNGTIKEVDNDLRGSDDESSVASFLGWDWLCVFFSVCAGSYWLRM